MGIDAWGATLENYAQGPFEILKAYLQISNKLQDGLKELIYQNSWLPFACKSLQLIDRRQGLRWVCSILFGFIVRVDSSLVPRWHFGAELVPGEGAYGNLEFFKYWERAYEVVSVSRTAIYIIKLGSFGSSILQVISNRHGFSSIMLTCFDTFSIYLVPTNIPSLVRRTGYM